jgi:hypothetical protein
MPNMACDVQPVDLHGSHGREYATGRGAVLATRELLLHAHAGKIANKDFVIQVCIAYASFDQSCILNVPLIYCQLLPADGYVDAYS